MPSPIYEVPILIAKICTCSSESPVLSVPLLAISDDFKSKKEVLQKKIDTLIPELPPELSSE